MISSSFFFERQIENKIKNAHYQSMHNLFNYFSMGKKQDMILEGKAGINIPNSQIPINFVSTNWC